MKKNDIESIDDMVSWEDLHEKFKYTKTLSKRIIRDTKEYLYRECNIKIYDNHRIGVVPTWAIKEKFDINVASKERLENKSQK